MLTVLVWLAMWGQQCKFIDGGGSYAVEKCGTVVNVIVPPKPAEHVIEIKTVRVPREVGTDCNYCDEIGCTLMWCQLPTAKECKEGEQFSASFKDETWGPKTVKREHYSCDAVTRELWIDGVRWGVVKGLE